MVFSDWSFIQDILIICQMTSIWSQINLGHL